MSHRQPASLRAIAAGVALSCPIAAAAYDSGSSGADGALAPTVNTEIVLPPSGVFNYSSVNIPTGVTVTFRKNATNTPVVMLVSGNVTIAGTLNVSGKPGADVGAAGSGTVGDDGAPGEGGPGGYGGGRGGTVGSTFGAGAGIGPGSGAGGQAAGTACGGGPYPFGGGGAGHAGPGGPPFNNCYGQNAGGAPGVAYGSAALLPLIGGSGGGGGSAGASSVGSGGGGGGGAILIAASGTINVSGAILANAANAGNSSGGGCGATGGGGSGGAIRLIATTIAGNGTISAGGGSQVSPSSCSAIGYGGAGSNGRIRFEAETYTRTAASTPAHSLASPGPVFIAGLPTLAISTVAGAAVPANPTGVADVSLPASTTNPVSVVFATTGVPVGNTITVKVTPAYGATSSALSNALSGSTANATASATVTLPTGPSTLQATVTYTIVASLGDMLSRYAQNERVEKITLSASMGSASKATLITVSGKRYEAPAEAMQIAALGN